MRSLPKALALAVVLTTLSGCQTFSFASSLFKSSKDAVPASAEAEAGRSLAAGREALQQGSPAEAIAPLRAALMDPSTHSEASNALGVAYAKIGRDDLAEHYFKAAIASDPTDNRFVANLLRLQHAALARRSSPESSALVALQDGEMTAANCFATPKPESRSEQTVAAGMVERRSRAEVFIASGKAQPAATATVAFMDGSAGKKALSAPAARPAPDASTAASAPTTMVVENPFGAKAGAPVDAEDRPS